MTTFLGQLYFKSFFPISFAIFYSLLIRFCVISQCNILLSNIFNILNISCKAPLGITGSGAIRINYYYCYYYYYYYYYYLFLWYFVDHVHTL